jgi:hypothetical protein
MAHHTIYDFVEFCGESHMDYLDKYTYRELTRFVQDSVDTSCWNRCDIVFVHMTYDCSSEPKPFIWDGDNLVYPFFNGSCNTIDSTIKCNIDDVICHSGYMPNIFQAFTDYDPNNLFSSPDFSMPSSIGFVDLSCWSDEICENVHTSMNVSTSYGEKPITICNFDGNKHLVILGKFDGKVRNHIMDNNVYDFSLSNLLFGYNVDLNDFDIHDICGGSADDYYFFIHPSHTDIDYNVEDDSEEYVSYSSSKFVGSTERSYTTKSVAKCCATTHTGSRCTNNAQADGLCGKHKRSKRRRH